MRDSPVWEAAFLAALERTGSVVAAGRGAGVSPRWAQQRRLKVASFAAAWGSALRAYRLTRSAALLAAEVAAGSRIAGTFGGVGAPRLERPGAPLDEGAIERFLDTLAATANVRRAAGAAGATPQGFYSRRRRDDGFRLAWDAALESGRARLESLLLARAIDRFDPEEIDRGDAERATLSDDPPMTIDEAMRLLAMAQGKPAGHGGEKWRQPRRSLAEVQDSILRKIEAIERAGAGERHEAGEDAAHEDGAMAATS